MPAKHSPALAAALAYCRRGWSVVPAYNIDPRGCTCRQDHTGDTSAGKHPRVKWQSYQQRRSTDDEIRTWWTRWPDANVAIITGTISGLVVIDVDPRHGGDASLSQLLPLPETPICLTGGGGQHVYLQHPSSIIPNGAALLPGIDLRGDGGYVIAPPSSHLSGRNYSWDPSPDDCPVAPIPPSIAQALANYRPPELPQAFDLESLMHSGIPQGVRNQTLTRVAGHYAGQGKSPDEVLHAVQAANRALCDPPMADAEVQTIVASITAREQRKTRAQAAIATSLADADHMGASERLTIAAAAWTELGVPAVTDWLLLMGDTSEYILVTPEAEARFGDDLLDQHMVERTLLRDLATVAPARLKVAAWRQIALRLRKVAREELVEPTRAGERLEDWLHAYCDRFPPAEVDPAERKDALAYGPIKADNRLCLRPPRLARFVEAQFGEKLTPSALRKLLRRANWEQAVLYIPPSSTTACWREPAKE